MSEKLYYYPNKTKALFYKRTFIDKDIQPSIKFGRSLRLNKTAQTSLKENTLNNQSVLSSCKKISFNESMKPFIMLRSGIEKYYNTINGKETLDIKARLEDVCANEHKRKFFLLMLKKSDFNITDFRVVAKNSVLSEDIREQIQELNISESVKRQFLDTEIDDVIFKHSSQNGSFDVSLDQQSKGTISFLQTLNTLYEIINENRICFIDELEEDLHPDLLMYYLKVFLFNSSKSQLIVTSQVLSLLSDDFLNENRGFVWLVEKNLDTASSKYTRGDFLGLHKNVSIYKSYKNGHLGAKPKLDSFFIDLDS